MGHLAVAGDPLVCHSTTDGFFSKPAMNSVRRQNVDFPACSLSSFVPCRAHCVVCAPTSLLGLASSMSDSSEHSSASSVVSDAGIMSSPRFKKPGTPRRSLSDRSRPSIKPPALARTLSDRSDKRTGSGSGHGLRPDKPRLVRPAGAPGSPSTCTGSPPAGRRSLRGSSAVYAASVLLKYGSPITAPIRAMNELYQHSLRTGPHGQPWTVREGLD